ncbi:MAG: hypothetical protein HWD86_03375 [Kangiellaceae bacterium]|nr:hypothetical protein [Kangiellaceae bacterium]
MKNILSLLILAFGISSAAYADEYNHGSHNDPYYYYATNSTMTIDCGSFSLATCINGASLENLAKNKCKTLIPNIDNGQYPPYGSSYYHSVTSLNVDVISAVDLNNGIGTNNFDVTLIYSCRALHHLGSISKF